MKSALPKSLRGSGGGHRTTANSSGSSGPGGGGSGGSGGSRHSRLSSVASLSPSSLSGWSCVCNRLLMSYQPITPESGDTSGKKRKAPEAET
jgi:hypothetical protein